MKMIDFWSIENVQSSGLALRFRARIDKKSYKMEVHIGGDEPLEYAAEKLRIFSKGITDFVKNPPEESVYE